MPELLERCVVASCSPLFRRDAISPLPSWYFELPWGDWSLYFLAAEHGALRYLPESMGVYRIHGGGMYSRLSRLEALEARTDFYGACASARARGRAAAEVAESWVKRALEHNRLVQRPPRWAALGKAARVSPRAAAARARRRAQPAAR